ncbi:MAG: hypothetical protein JRJ85_09505 [Deltaproteobacteria bacterium]|nr:hypothetical protein [Deltaproteobacteria bacterium]
MNPPDNLKETKPVLKIRDTDFDYAYNDDWSEMIKALCGDDQRNGLIATDILQTIATSGAKALVISERIGQLEKLLTKIKTAYRDGEIITGKISEKDKTEILKRFDQGKIKILMVTFKSIPAIEVKGVNHLFICSALKFDNHLTHIVGKILNNGHMDQRPVIYDYRDKPEILRASLKRRLKTYRAMGAVTPYSA